MFTPGPGDDREIVPLPAGANGSTETGGWQSALKRAETAYGRIIWRRGHL